MKLRATATPSATPTHVDVAEARRDAATAEDERLDLPVESP